MAVFTVVFSLCSLSWVVVGFALTHALNNVASAIRERSRG